MNVSVSSGNVNKNLFNIHGKKKILLAGPANNNHKAREIMLPANSKEVLNMFGNNDLYNSYKILVDDMNVKNVYIANCYSNSDYIRLMDKIIHYDFDYFVPIDIYFGDKFYNSIEDKDQFFVDYFLIQLSQVNSLTTLIMTERHASLYEDFDHYMNSMSYIENSFFSEHEMQTNNLLETSGNNLLFVYNNLKNIPYANVILSGLFAQREYSKYLHALTMSKAIYDIDYFDMIGLRAMFFKNNTYTNNVTIENPFNFKKTQDIYSNALIDDVIKNAIKSLNLDSFKGKLYNQYTALQIESAVNNALKDLKGLLFKDYKINNITFKKIDITAGIIIIDYSIIPYGTLESINIIMGV